MMMMMMETPLFTLLLAIGSLSSDMSFMTNQCVNACAVLVVETVCDVL